MYRKTAHQQYSSTQFSTVDRGRLLMMLLEGGVKFLRQAQLSLESGDKIKFARFLSKGQAIILELQNTLNFEAGEEARKISEQLDRLYDFMLFYLTEANIQKDALKVSRVADILQTVTDGFSEIFRRGDLDLSNLDSTIKKAESKFTNSNLEIKDNLENSGALNGSGIRVSY